MYDVSVWPLSDPATLLVEIPPDGISVYSTGLLLCPFAEGFLLVPKSKFQFIYDQTLMFRFPLRQGCMEIGLHDLSTLVWPFVLELVYLRKHVLKIVDPTWGHPSDLLCSFQGQMKLIFPLKETAAMVPFLYGDTPLRMNRSKLEFEIVLA